MHVYIYATNQEILSLNTCTAQIHAIYEHVDNTPSRIIKYAFRIIYNGKSITSHVTGCSHDLCDLKILFHNIESFATDDTIDCSI